MKVEIEKIRTWESKVKGEEGCVRFYIKNILLGVAYPVRHSEFFTFERDFDYRITNVSISDTLSLEQIKDELELSLKEFISKIIKIKKDG